MSDAISCGNSPHHTYIRSVRIHNRRRDLQPKIRNTHAESISDPARRLRMADADPLDDGADGQQQCKPQRIETRLGRPLASVSAGVLVDQPVCEPTGIGFSDQASDQQWYAEYKAGLCDVETVELSEDH